MESPSSLRRTTSITLTLRPKTDFVFEGSNALIALFCMKERPRRKLFADEKQVPTFRRISRTIQGA
jgi:hypothetical protein